MTQENKELLFQDLCSRLPYGVIGAVEHYDEIDNSPADLLGVLQGFDNNCKGIKFVYLPEYTDDAGAYNWFSYIRFKPYLRPMSSMTDEEREDFWKNVLDVDWRELEFDEEPDTVPFPFTENDCGFYLDFIYLADLFAVFDWLNKKMFDYRGLIPKGLAIAVTEYNNPYKD